MKTNRFLLTAVFTVMAFTFSACSNDGESPNPSPNDSENSRNSDSSSSSVGVSYLSSSDNENFKSNDSSSSSGGIQYSSSSNDKFSLSSSSFNGPLKECTGIFNPDNKFCYDGNVYDKCDGMEYNPTTHICSGDIANPAICNGIAYNPLLNQICEGSIVKERCGTGNIYRNPATEQCCGNNKYTSATQFCQGGTNAVKMKCGTQTYNASQTCENSVIKDRCGTGNIYHDPETEQCCGNNKYITATQFCNENAVYFKCDDEEYNPANQRCQNNVVETQCGTGNNYHNPATQFCNGNKVLNKCGGDIYNISTEYCSNGTMKTYGSVTDDGGKTYKTVVIGNQVWMAENLNYNVSGSLCYGNLESNCNIYGRLYNWTTARTVCPTGWRLPSDNEWTTLVNYIEDNYGCTSCAGTRLSSGSDDYGFTALLGGGYYDSFYDIGNRGYWWSTSEVSITVGTSNSAYYSYISQNSGAVNKNSQFKSYFLSVRCIKS